MSGKHLVEYSQTGRVLGVCATRLVAAGVLPSPFPCDSSNDDDADAEPESSTSENESPSSDDEATIVEVQNVAMSEDLNAQTNDEYKASNYKANNDEDQGMESQNSTTFRK